MFDSLEADIVVFQEAKIQQKDLTDEMVLVPGWDCYFSLPKHKKGCYALSFVGTGTGQKGTLADGAERQATQSVCAPIRAEEGITGTCSPPSSSTAQQIGGYPTAEQLSDCPVDAVKLDSEGRAVVLEFPAFILIGVYSPANRDDTRDDFRLTFLTALDARVRNLHAMGKRVVLAGDLNIVREELDTTNAEASMRKQVPTSMEFVSTPARRLLNQLLDGGKVFGGCDRGRERPVMWDVCRGFHPDRKGMFTCWNPKLNARPANVGSRIDYVLCSMAMNDWFSDSNIQEGLMGSDHCPVYAVIKDTVDVDGQPCNIRDIMNPHGMFISGRRQREYSNSSDMLPLSGRLLPEFAGRRYIRDMFSQQSLVIRFKPSAAPLAKPSGTQDIEMVNSNVPPFIDTEEEVFRKPPRVLKRSWAEHDAAQPLVKRFAALAVAEENLKLQPSIKAFFKPKDSPVPLLPSTQSEANDQIPATAGVPTPTLSPTLNAPNTGPDPNPSPTPNSTAPPPVSASQRTPEREVLNASPEGCTSIPWQATEMGYDPWDSDESGCKSARIPPRCDDHNEPCIARVTQRDNIDRVPRSFWMCPRPVGPSGIKEKNTPWCCQTFMWASEWNLQEGVPW
ncbi:MAG: hypothetical protein Q9163_004119 [Psora crenata]